MQMRLKLQIKRIKELFKYGFTALSQDGFAPTVKRALGFFKRRFGAKKGRFLPPKQVLELQRNANFSSFASLSICVPLYNTPVSFLRQFLNSVTAQTCPNWQLCIADASSENKAEIEEIVKSYNDKRIAYIKVENEGISANTNAAAQLATGEFIALADHDDILSPDAVFMVLKTAEKTKASFLYSDEALFTTDYKKPITGHFKPDFAPDYLNCCNYICHLAAFKRDLFWQVGGLNKACDGSQDHDLFLKLSEITTPVHIPRVLYYWRVHANSTSLGTGAKPYVQAAAKKAIGDHLKRIGANAVVENGLFDSTYNVKYILKSEPLISILIPNKDHIEDLDKALKSIFEKTTYKNYEIIVIENNSEKAETFEYYKKLENKHSNVKIAFYEGGFNFSAINNFGRKYAKGEFLLLLNNDVEIINEDWLMQMVSLCAQPLVGIVGAKLYYPDNTLQHAGVITGLGGFAGHSHKYAKREGSGYMFRTATVQNFSAVTAACLLVKASVYDEVNGLDEEFTVAFNDVDFCLRVGDKGYRILFTPYAQLYHYESKSRGLDEKDETKRKRFDGERARMVKLYGKRLVNDPFYNVNLTLDREDFSESSALPEYKI